MAASVKDTLDAGRAAAVAQRDATGERGETVVALDGEPLEGFDALVAELRGRVAAGKVAIVAFTTVATINDTDDSADCATVVLTPSLTPATLTTFIRGNLPAMLGDAVYAGVGKALKAQIDAVLKDYAQAAALVNAPLDTTKPN